MRIYLVAKRKAKMKMQFIEYIYSFNFFLLTNTGNCYEKCSDGFLFLF